MSDSILSYRHQNIFILFMAISSMAVAMFFMQMYLELEPCPLCIFQRLGMIVMGSFALLATLINPAKKWARLALFSGSFLGAAWAAGVATRHVWLQNLPPDQVPSCGPGLDFLLEAFPLSQVLHQVFSGSGECAEVSFTFLGLTLAEQSLTLFSFLVLVHLYLLVTILKKRI